MRKLLAAGLVAVSGMVVGAPAQADWVSPVQGNDTGGIIAYTVAQQSDARQIAVCAHYRVFRHTFAVENLRHHRSFHPPQF